MSDDFLLNPASLIHAFIFEIEHGIDPVLAFEGTETVFQPPAGEDGAVARSALTFEVEFGRPAAGHTIFDFRVGGKEQPLAGTGNPECAAGLDLEIARFFEMMIVSHEIWGLLRAGTRRRSCQKKEKKRYPQPCSRPDAGKESRFHGIPN